MYGSKLKKIRKNLSVTQDEMANLLKIAVRTYAAYEREENNPPYSMLINLCSKFHLNLNWFFTDLGEMFNNECENTHVLLNNSDCVNRFKSWGDRLCNILSENMITPKEFAKRAGINPERVENFILNSAEPTMAEINAIKSNIDVSIDELFYGEKVAGNNPVVQPQFTADEILKLKKLIS